MISLYRWNHAEKRGRWDDAPELTEPAAIPENEVWWIDLDGPTEAEELQVFQTFFPVHPLSLEDIVKIRREPDRGPHFPKVEEFPDYLFVIVDPLAPWPAPGQTPESTDPQTTPGTPARHRCIGSNTQLSAVLNRRVLITHHYEDLDSVRSVKSFLGRHAELAGRGPDYLFHLVLDAMVDEYAPEIDRLIDRFEDIENVVFENPSNELLAELIRLKRRVVALRKTLILEREVLARLTRGEFELVDDREIVYYRNVFDHLVRYTELIEGTRDMVGDLMQIHLAATSNKMNGIVKVLTMISTIILPMSLIAGIYGMNFKTMPELEWTLGYPWALMWMFLFLVGSVGFFRWKKWL
jgi:magnesium transporter